MTAAMKIGEINKKLCALFSPVFSCCFPVEG